jgi:serine phosphatase RsbU (regulator of sigma subunit)
MTIRRRLTLSYAVLLLLGAANLALYLGTSRLRTQAMNTLARALQRETLLSSIRQEVDDLYKQVTLLSEMDFDTGEGAGGVPQGRQLFVQKLHGVTDLLAKLKSLAEPRDVAAVAAVQKQYADLSIAWEQFYEYLGVEQTWAVANAAKAEPLSLRLQRQMLPSLQASEQAHVKAAQDEFARVEKLADRLSIVVFVISAVLAFGVAYLVSRHLARGFQTLKHGTDLIGGMNLEHRIELRGHDELADFAGSFNAMAHKLKDATAQLTEANVELQRRAEEIARRQKRELDLAAAIQQGLMQVRIPDLPFVNIRARNLSCTQIGGDFFDIIHNDGALAAIICDVSGKGISAAIMASVIQGMIRADIAANMPLAAIACDVNRFLSQRDVGGKYATVCLLRIDAAGHLEYVTCGHIPPVLVRGAEVRRLRESQNVPVGLLGEMEFESAHTELLPGDRIILVTDGVTEAANAADDFFGDERLEQAACDDDSFDSIFGSLQQFCGDTPFNDDCTVVEISFAAAGQSALSSPMATAAGSST